MSAIELRGIKMSSGVLIPYFVLPYTEDELDVVTGAGSGSFKKAWLMRYTFSAVGNVAPEPVASELRAIYLHVSRGSNPAAALTPHAGIHRFMRDGEPVADTEPYFNISAGALVWEDHGLVGQRLQRSTGSIGGGNWSTRTSTSSPGRWHYNRHTRYTPVWMNWITDLSDMEALYPGSVAVIQPRAAVLTSDGMLMGLQFVQHISALGMLGVAYEGLDLNLFGNGPMPDYDTVHIAWVTDGDDKGDDMPRFNPRTATNTVGTYFLSKLEVEDFIGELWSTSLIENIKAAFIGDGSNALLGLQWFYGLDTPSAPKSGATYDVAMGNVQFQVVEARHATHDFMEFDFGSVSVPRRYGDWRDYSACTYQIYLPFVGVVPLDAQDVVGKELYLKYFINLTDGSCVCQLTNESGGPDARAVVFQATGQWGYDIPVKVGGAKDPTSSVIRSLTASMFGGEAERSYAAGSLTPNANVMSGFKARISCYVRDEQYTSVKQAEGEYSTAMEPVKNFSGYLKVRTVWNGGTLAMRQADRIIEMLQEGIYL